jgi:tetratricopeptide (TPR) repeat protein
MCGGTIEFNEGDTIGVCDSCGTKQTLPRLDSDRKTNLYDRANHFRRNNEFDKAMSIYENILNEDPTDAEAYWSLVLCRYGIEYVEDPATHRRVPTVNRAQFTSIFDDEDYKSALKNADVLQRTIYEDEARTINEIQKGILEISAKEEPFDVFICYKDTDANGRRTPDSVLATDLYHQLTNEGFKVFFSRITLEDKLGQEYEPYIFAALNSAKAMVVLGTKPEHFNAVWVKNEWSRYLALIKAGAKKTLIPAYRDMDPYDLPEEFSHLQAQDMSKLGFMQDLIRGIKKIVRTDEPKPTTIRETVVQQTAQTNTAPLLRRAFMFLEDSNWQSADEYCEKVLDLDPENAEAYLSKLMAELHVRTRDALKDQPEPFDDRNNYKKAYRFGDEKLKAKLSGDIAFIKERNETARLTGIYNNGVKAMNAASTESAYKSAVATFRTIPGFQDADALAERCLEKAEICRKNAIYQSACSLMTGNAVSGYESAIKTFRTIPGWKDADDQILACERKIEEIKAKEEADRLERERKAEEARITAEKRKKRNNTIVLIVFAVIVVAIAAIILFFTVIQPNQRYNEAKSLYEAGQYEDAIIAFKAMDGYKDSSEQIISCKYAIAQELYRSEHYEDAMETFEELDGFADSKAMINTCRDAITERDYNSAVALMKEEKYEDAIQAFSALDGYKDSLDQIEVCKTAIPERDYNLAKKLYDEGNYLAAIQAFKALNGYKDSEEQIEVCNRAYYGPDYDNATKQYDQGNYAEAGILFAKTGRMQKSYACWDKVAARKAIDAGYCHTVGLKADGTVVVTKYTGKEKGYDRGQFGVTGWSDIIAIAAGSNHTVGLRANGTVVATEYTGKAQYNYGQNNVSGWNSIVAISAGGGHTVGLKADGTVVAVGRNEDGACNVSSWASIVMVSAGAFHTVGLKSDGTAVATKFIGNQDYNHGQCNVSGWKDIVSVSAGYGHTVGLRADGTVVAIGDNDAGQCDVTEWENIVAIAAGYRFTAGLKADGTVISTSIWHNTSNWNDIVEISAGYYNLIGRKKDGTVVSIGGQYGQDDVSSWRTISISDKN